MTYSDFLYGIFDGPYSRDIKFMEKEIFGSKSSRRKMKTGRPMSCFKCNASRRVQLFKHENGYICKDCKEKEEKVEE